MLHDWPRQSAPSTVDALFVRRVGPRHRGSAVGHDRRWCGIGGSTTLKVRPPNASVRTFADGYEKSRGQSMARFLRSVLKTFAVIVAILLVPLLVWWVYNRIDEAPSPRRSIGLHHWCIRSRTPKMRGCSCSGWERAQRSDCARAQAPERLRGAPRASGSCAAECGRGCSRQRSGGVSRHFRGQPEIRLPL